MAIENNSKIVAGALKLAKVRKPGRPKAIPEELEPVVAELYKLGNGYRAISRILREEYHCNPHFSSVRLLIKRLGLLPTITVRITKTCTM